MAGSARRRAPGRRPRSAGPACRGAAARRGSGARRAATPADRATGRGNPRRNPSAFIPPGRAGSHDRRAAGCVTSHIAVWSPLTEPRQMAMRSAARTLRHPAELAAAGLVPPERLGELAAVASKYAIAISPAMAELIDPSDPHDPIARQFVPDPAELRVAAGERADPIGDDAKSPLAGIVHRYPDRVLLKL